ncbi:hypothetical protein [Streptomyces sp. WAC01526]|uniref:hypothetical protein n=1 Tax=Streptomyces sp. WAC01526 TaxID=2588709 RepID=UPI0011DFA395|nr:hypothetical protein [Streptomyces sp. WAC01526]
MEWTTLLATVLGATIGVGSTLLAERMRSAREAAVSQEARRHDLYAAYLAALSRVADELWSLGHGEDRTNLQARAHDVWQRGDVYPLRYQMTIDAPDRIASASDACFRNLRAFRDVVGAGAEGGTDAFLEAQYRYDGALTTLRQGMRSDLEAA